MKFREGENVHVIVGNELLNGWYNGKEFGTGNSLVKVSRDKIISTKDCFIAKEKEAELVVVPQCVDDWFIFCTSVGYDLANALYIVKGHMPVAIYEWLQNNNDNQELLARAWMDGYEVEKEPLYYVKLPFVSQSTDFEKETTYTYIIVNITTDEMQPSTSNRNHGSWKAELTEEQIKDMPGGDVYWQFAVLVEEVEERA
ncbi:DUF1642 domain-containing protein [Listeria monocytogenes]|uniref:DUF1642 domain-containing protein n=1 Tax=Listeria monocytogenes TaxID=1639 RepID=UPI00097CBDA2|nr:DUF1642 domain-containing protein [Listeria monocytogenes]EAC4174378.1 DUF1642 domain-containing protein [Listeria monocytogenes]EAE9441559.1 DUF1642 domain-containing protein [Listeria monocytogenes]EAH1551450.1 DUF1642 domain-containing protein [Listeria monocytogenes]ECX5805697.1 DUF1642 domain-containing protein [Listeria monocytogenes]ECX5827775.1 DUF1642 domain-containing protein [Listeria monocytogenes]